MKIDVRKNTDNTLDNILQAILKLDDEQFKRATKTVSFEEDAGLEFYYGEEKIDLPISVIFKHLDDISEKLGEDSEYAKKLQKLVQSRGPEQLKNSICEQHSRVKPHERLMVQKIYEFLSNDELFDKFKDFDNNKEDFRIPGGLDRTSQNIDNYIRIMRAIFGDLDEKGDLVNSEDFLDRFYIPNLEEMQERYKQLYREKGYSEHKRRSEYAFDSNNLKDDKAIVQNDEPEWELSEEIKQAVLGDMPEGLSPEEKAIYVYEKMCKVFAYDEGYMFRGKTPQKDYTSTFSKERLESLRPNSKITCFDFSRMYPKLIKELGDDIDAVIITQGGHFYTGFSTRNCQATLEAINMKNGKDIYSSNDLARGKIGAELNGIEHIGGDKNLLTDAIKRVHTLFAEKGEKAEKSTTDYVQELMEQPIIAEPTVISQIENIELIRSLVNNAKKLGINGNEFTVLFNDLYHKIGSMYRSLETSFIGEAVENNGSTEYKRKIWFREKGKNNTESMYLIDTETLDIEEVSKEQMKEKLASGQFIYEDEKRKMEGFEIGG